LLQGGNTFAKIGKDLPSLGPQRDLGRLAARRVLVGSGETRQDAAECAKRLSPGLGVGAGRKSPQRNLPTPKRVPAATEETPNPDMEKLFRFSPSADPFAISPPLALPLKIDQ
jgi:hypothetical protein